MKIRVGVVDDKLVNRASVASILHDQSVIELVESFQSGEAFLEYIHHNGENLDVVLMDLEMTGLSGSETIFRAKNNQPHIKFIVLTVFEESDMIFNAIKCGAHGYLLKEDTTTNLIDSIIAVYQHGAVPMSPVVARKIFQFMSATVETAGDMEKNPLSKREAEILKLLTSSKSYKKIGEILFISPFTVRRHVNNIYEKLHVKSRAEIVNIAMKNKWI